MAESVKLLCKQVSLTDVVYSSGYEEIVQFDRDYEATGLLHYESAHGHLSLGPLLPRTRARVVALQRASL